MKGGSAMNSEYIKNKDPLQLQQMIIFLKAELAKYKQEVKKYHDSYHYSLAEKLEQENIQLVNEKNMLSEELHTLHKEFEKRTNDYEKHIHLHEIQSEKYITSIDTLRKTKTGLWTTNKQLTDVINDLKDGLDTSLYNDRQITSFYNKIAEYKTTIEQLENKLVHLIQESNTQVQSRIEKLDITTQKRIESEKVQQHLLKEIEEKSSIIRRLQSEVSVLQKQNKKIVANKSGNRKNSISTDIGSYDLTNLVAIDAETLLQLDRQIKELLAKSLDYEEKLDAKLILLNTLEHELDQITGEIEAIKMFRVDDRVSKKY